MRSSRAFPMAMVSIQFSLVRAGLSSARWTKAPSSSAHLTSAFILHSSTSRPPATIAHKLVASQCPILSHGSFLLFGIASPALWALLPTSPAAFASEQIVESGGAAVGTDAGDANLVVNILGTAAFVGLGFLTIGIIYLGVSDFLEKRERDEEAKKISTESTAKKSKKGSVTASRGGAKGFGKRPQDEE